jgi:low affinity Fe/Cu permease
MIFSRIAHWTSEQFGRSYAFLAALVVVLVWIVTGPIFDWSDTWQLVINTGTTIVTFLAVFLLQHTQNRDTLAIQIKLDELIRATRNASNAVIKIDELSEAQLRAKRARRVRKT